VTQISNGHINIKQWLTQENTMSKKEQNENNEATPAGEDQLTEEELNEVNGGTSISGKKISSGKDK
jgi:bacteriocin-like protein